MAFQIPELIKIEMSRAFESILHRRGGSDHSLGSFLKAAIGLFLFCGLVALSIAFIRHRPQQAQWLSPPAEAWFYDQNTGEIFKNKICEQGSIETPSGPLASGEPAGVRAHVYSYTLEPKDSELFVGYLERPNPKYSHKYELSSDMKDYHQWAYGRLVKHPDDDQWVSAASAEGYHIVRSLVQPNKKGQTPIYQFPQ